MGRTRTSREIASGAKQPGLICGQTTWRYSARTFGTGLRTYPEREGGDPLCSRKNTSRSRTVGESPSPVWTEDTVDIAGAASDGSA